MEEEHMIDYENNNKKRNYQDNKQKKQSFDYSKGSEIKSP